MEFNTLKIGDIIENKISKVRYKVKSKVNDRVFEIENQKHFGMTDYINTNTVNEYDFTEQ